MDLNDELCRSDFFDFVKIGEPGSGGLLTPVAFIDSSSIDYAQTDGNNNLGSIGIPISKSFLDEVLLDSTGGNDPLQMSHNTLELLGTFQWSSIGGDEVNDSHNHSSNSPTLSSDATGTTWLPPVSAPNDGVGVEMTTLTNLLTMDPLFVTYEDTKMDQYFSSPASVSNETAGVISSDLISTTFLSEPSDSPPSSESSGLINWSKGTGTENFTDDSLLRTALQAGVKATAVIVTSKSNEMTELRKVLSFPPLTSSTIAQVPVNTSGSSPTSTDPNSEDENSPSRQLIVSSGPGTDQQFYELKMLDPLFVENDANIPNVEELIMTRIDNTTGKAFGLVSNKNPKLSDAACDKKINSTTLSTKWTYTTPNEQGKPPRRRNGKKKQNAVNIGMNNNVDISVNGNNSDGYSPSSGASPTNGLSSNNATGSPTGSNNGNARKERSLHYCSICCKGFKDKYSVNVHVRTHTGEKPFSCTMCGKNFRQKAHLAKHYQTHAAKAANGTHHPKAISSNVKR